MTEVMREVVTHRHGDTILASRLEDITECELEKAQKDFESSRECDHSLVKDEPGWLYDFRSCAICGKGLGAI